MLQHDRSCACWPCIQVLTATVNRWAAERAVAAEWNEIFEEEHVKLSLNAQITEVQKEIEMRSQVYPRQVSTRKMKENEASYKMNAMRSVLETLKWLQNNEALIRQRLDLC